MLYRFYGFSEREQAEAERTIIAVARENGVDHPIVSSVALPKIEKYVREEATAYIAKAIELPVFKKFHKKGMQFVVNNFSRAFPDIPIFASTCPVVAALNGNAL